MHPCDNTEALLRVLNAPRRNNYFYGKRMDVPHFRMEQDYGKYRQWLLNRLTLGKGVVCGLKVSLDGDRLCVDPGVAIDGLGREIIVPVRACIDPATGDGGCCAPCCGSADIPDPPAGGETTVVGTPGSSPYEGGNHAMDTTTPARGASAAQGLFTLWACYKECKAEYQPVLVSDCGSREACEAGTIVESFCLKVTPGHPPLQGDPAWCAHLWPKKGKDDGKDDGKDLAQPAASDEHLTREEMRAALAGRRRVLCELFDDACDPSEGDPCVPLALLRVADGKVRAFDSCLVRPHVYSNTRLLDMILCLAEKIDECCGHDKPKEPQPEPTPLLRVASVDFLGGPNLDVIASVQSPATITKVPINKQGSAIRVKFTAPFAQDAHKPATPGMNAANWKKFNVLVVPEPASPNGPFFVPGKIVVEGPDTIRFDVVRENPFFDSGYKGWQKGQLRMRIFGDDDTTAGRLAVTDTGGVELDGEPIAPAAGAMSGDGTKGGEFTFLFRIG
jgi:hypothetical protein